VEGFLGVGRALGLGSGKVSWALEFSTREFISGMFMLLSVVEVMVFRDLEPPTNSAGILKFRPTEFFELK
jgi:hypothetical protein